MTQPDEQDNRTDKQQKQQDRHRRCIGVRVRLREYETLCHDLRSRYKGVLTPTGKDKKLPWFFVGWCSRCEEVKFSGSRYPLASRFRCHEDLSVHDGICGAELRPLQPIGITRAGMHKNWREWREKYG